MPRLVERVNTGDSVLRNVVGPSVAVVVAQLMGSFRILSPFSRHAVDDRQLPGGRVDLDRRSPVETVRHRSMALILAAELHVAAVVGPLQLDHDEPASLVEGEEVDPPAGVFPVAELLGDDEQILGPTAVSR